MTLNTICRCQPSSQLRRVVVAVCAVALCACGGTTHPDSAPQRVAVLSAFPAEMAPLLEQTTVEDTMVLNGRTFRIGTLGGVPVVIGLTGIGLLNAAMTTRAVLEQFAVTGVIVSAVAGSTLQIASVAVPEAWKLEDGTSYSVDPGWLDLAGAIAAPGGVSLERCTVPVSDPSRGTVCMIEPPAVVVGGIGRSTDRFGKTPVRCQPNGDDVFGCDITSGDGTSGQAADAEAPVANDNETAAIAAEAAARGVRFIAFRAASDGIGDPLDLPGFPAQFFAYYRLAARNAAAATRAFLERLSAGQH